MKRKIPLLRPILNVSESDGITCTYYCSSMAVVLGRIMYTKFERGLARQNFSTAVPGLTPVLNLTLNLVLNLTNYRVNLCAPWHGTQLYVYSYREIGPCVSIDTLLILALVFIMQTEV